MAKNNDKESQKLQCFFCRKSKQSIHLHDWKLSPYDCQHINRSLPDNPELIPGRHISLCTRCWRHFCIRHNKRRYNKLPKNKLCNNVRTGISKSLRTGKHGLWEWHVGYSLAKLRWHLERLFEPDMSWQNYGLWHIDHRRPIATFNFDSIEDPAFRECWTLDNLQPLWARENWTKKKYSSLVINASQAYKNRKVGVR